MTPEWVAAIASLGTLVVIAATAVAALIQLRHMRSGNQIVVLSEIRETMESQYFRDTLEQVHQGLPTLLNDPHIRARILASKRLTEISELTPVRTLANFYEGCGAFVKAGIVDKKLFCDIWANVVLRDWEIIAPLVANVRAAREAPEIWDNFEYLAAVSRQFANKYPNLYPRGTPHEQMPALWPETAKLLDER
ncbi:MAG: DUF4760 domain-containing protein [Candidatus Eremiobacteraeota bacterium]|nr:DUF4760 domain-containing protein [Candidatus Eremiobacteraeota bacterium]